MKITTSGAAGQSFGAFNNSGVVLSHTGTCNDGVGKGMCGGEVIVNTPAGGGNGDGENVLIGNFALFGATGGRAFIAGQAGDRFAVRNSGATAVVEGVGDFCCEYMTNGAVLNLGEFSKGLGNGMSGGFAYQYDPRDRLSDLISHDSVFFGCFADESEQSRIHENAVKTMLSWHVEATGSIRGRFLLDEWEATRTKMYWIMPKALLQYQDSDAILRVRTRKELADELAGALASHQLNVLKAAYKSGEPILSGSTPGYGETDTAEMFRLVNCYTVMEKAQSIAEKRAPKGSEHFDRHVRNLILTEDFELVSSLAKHAKQAVAHYDEHQLAAFIADKRIKDFKRALSMRISSPLDPLGTDAWIAHQDEKNKAALGEIPSFDELFAQAAVPDMLQRKVVV